MSELWTKCDGRFSLFDVFVVMLTLWLYKIQCTWEAYYARRSRGENVVADPPKQTEAFHKLLIEYHAYACKLETLLDDYTRAYAPLHARDFRLERPRDPDDLLGLSLSLGEFHLDDEEDKAAERDDPTNILLWHDLSTVSMDSVACVQNSNDLCS
jgi:hypothetical protein